jgi:hypothetical protein
LEAMNRLDSPSRRITTVPNFGSERQPLMWAFRAPPCRLCIRNQCGNKRKVSRLIAPASLRR